MVDLMGPSEVKVKKIGDENVFGRAMLLWGREGIKEKVTDIFPLSVEKILAEETERKPDNQTEPN